MFRRHLARRAAAITQGAPAPANPDEWRQRRPALRKQLLYMLGLDPMPRKTPLEARVTGGFEREDYRVENIVFQSMPGLYVTGNLYLPKGRTGPAPAVLYLCGHSPWPEGAKVDYQHHGIWFARHGYVALLIDTIEFGELRGLHHGTHDLGRWYWHSLGYTPAGPEVWDAVRALDYLETRPEVDADRVAVTGISGGGAITWYAAAVDERFRVAVPVCATWTVEHQVALQTVQGNCDCIYFTNGLQSSFALAAALIAPRPLKIISALRDSMFPPAGYRRIYELARPFYEMFGAPEKLGFYEHDARHADILPFRKEADEWINRWLKNDLTPFEEGEIRPEPHGRLRVLRTLPPDAVNGHIDKRFIRTAELREPATLEEWRRRRERLLGELREKVFAAFPRTQAPWDAWKQEKKGWPSRYAARYEVEFSTEPGVRVRGELFVPRGAPKARPALIYVRRAGDIVWSMAYDFLLPALDNHVVLVLDPRAVDYPLSNYEAATLKRTVALVGATLESMQVWDILRAVDYLTGHEKLELSAVSVYGRGEMGALGLYAAALDERINRVILDDPPATHWQGPALLNVLRITDLPEAAALVAPREIVSLTPLPAAYDYTASIYALYGQADRIRHAGSLYDALEVWKAAR